MPLTRVFRGRPDDQPKIRPKMGAHNIDIMGKIFKPPKGKFERISCLVEK